MDKSNRKIKEGRWETKQLYYIKEIIFFTTLDIEQIVNELIDAFTQKTYMNYVVEEFKPRRRNKGEEQSDYIANMAGVGGETFSHSHYTKEDNPIKITLPDGSLVDGIIRVANHKSDIGTFAKNNPNIDYCISIVVGEKERVNPNLPVPDEREVHIIEYVLKKEYENKEHILMNIADKIVNIKLQGWTKQTDIGMGNTKFSEITNKNEIYNNIDENTLIKIILESIKKHLNK